MDTNNFFQSKTFKIVLGCLGGLIIVLLIFKLGMVVGFKKANFSYRWGENYHQNFAGPRGGFFNRAIRDFSDQDFIGAHGVFGQIIKIDPIKNKISNGVDGSILVIKGQDNIEKVVLVKDNTVIDRFMETVKLSDLKVDDYIVVIGDPNESGQIEAKLIRIVPPPPQASLIGQKQPEINGRAEPKNNQGI